MTLPVEAAVAVAFILGWALGRLHPLIVDDVTPQRRGDDVANPDPEWDQIWRNRLI